MIRAAFRNGILAALLLMLLFFKAIELAHDWTAQPVAYPVASSQK